MFSVILMEKKLLEPYMKKSSKKLKEFRIEKITKRKGNKLCIEWKGYDNSFSRWIDKKRQCKVNI